MEVAVENIVHKFTKAISDNFSGGVFPENVRNKALADLQENRFPTTRDEYWKYTRVNRISTKSFKTQQGKISSIESMKITDLDSNVVVFVNGFFAPQFSDLNILKNSGVEILSQSKIEPKFVEDSGHIFDQLNQAFATDGVQIHVAKNVVLEKPVEIIHIQTGNEVMNNLFHNIEVERHAQAQIVMSFYSSDAENCFTNLNTTIRVQDGAHLRVSKIQTEDNSNYHISTENVSQEANSNFTINTITLGGELVRNNLNIKVDGQNCETNLHSAYILKENQHIDNHTVVDHRVPNCVSNELYKGVIDDKATAVFNGKVFVRKDAQKINAFQSNGNVLLSNDATINSKPELEIYADDVKCSHGSTTGQLDEKAVFYLRSRGMGEKQARELLVQAFVGDVLEKLDEPVRNSVEQILETRFGWEVMA
jgi:Fe-S cluster assembly protein SufD